MARTTTEKAKAVVGIQFAGVEAEIKKLEPKMAKLGNAIPKGAKGGFKAVLAQVERLKKELAESNDPETFKNLQLSMGAVADEAERIGKILSKTQGKRGQILEVGETNRATNALRHYKDQMRQTATATQRTSLASQNMLRVIQDSPFGMLGMANNIQMLGEDISRGLAKGTSAADTLKGALRSLVAGPMAIAAVIAIGTLIIQKWDAIVDAGTRFGEMLDGLSEKQRDLNQAMRDFNSDESFEKFVDGMSPEDLQNSKKALEGYIEFYGDSVEDIEKLQLDRINRQSGLQSDRLTRLERDTIQKRVDLREELADQLHEVNKKIMLDEAEKARDLKFGIEDEEAKKDAERKKKKADADAERRRKEQLKILKAERDYWYETEQEKNQMARDAVIAENRRIQEAHDYRAKKKKERDAAARAELSRQLQSSRKFMQNLNKGISGGDRAATAIGAGAMGAAAADLSRNEQQERVNMEAFWEKARLEEKIAIRRDAQKELDDRMSREQGQALTDLQTHHQRLEDEITGFEGRRVEITVSAEEKILRMKKRAREEDLGHMASIASSTGQMFGSMASLMASEGEKGLENHRGLMKAAATAEAIAASISIFRGMVRSNPLSVAAAFAASGAVLMSLMSKIRQIDNPNGASSSASISGGRFTALNGNVAAGRANDYAAGQERLNSSSTAQAASDGAKQNAALIEAMQDQKVVIDQATIAEVARTGEKTNQRRVQTSG